MDRSVKEQSAMIEKLNKFIISQHTDGQVCLRTVRNKMTGVF